MPRRIWSQIFIVLLFAVIVPLTILAIFLTNTSQEAVKTSVLRDYQEIAYHTTGEIRQHIIGARQALSVTASILGTLHADPWRQETTIVELALKYPIFTSVSSIDNNGQEITTSKLGTALKNKADEMSFKQALNGEEYLSEVTLSDNHVPQITMAVPVKRLGKIKGVLAAELSLRGVWDIIDKLKFGQTGQAFIIDRNNRIIAHQDKKLVLGEPNGYIDNFIQSIQEGGSGSAQAVDSDNIRIIFAYATIADLKWKLIIVQEEAEAFAFLKKMQYQALFIFAFSLVITILLSSFLARWMSRPLNKIILGTQKVAQGDFSSSLRVRRRDEIGKLFFSFNRMTQQLREARKVEKLSIIGKAAAAIAHELKNSLVLVNTFIELLPKRHKDQKFIKEFFETVPQELDSWNNMLRNMMSINPPELENIPFSDLSINDIIKNMIALAQMKADQKDISLKLFLDESNPTIPGNEEKIRHAILNIITNALDATPYGGQVEIQTKLGLRQREHLEAQVEIVIINNGEHIDESQIDKIFEPFFTTKGSGVGLGLAISKEIIKAHSGTITVVNQFPKGVIFTIILPSKTIPSTTLKD
jgi:signal transduction histidine kinase